MFPRDGANTSLWQDTSESYPGRQRAGKKHFDVVIVGGGITGISAAHLLQGAGFHCAVLEAQALCFGTTGGTTAHINTLLDTPYYRVAKDFGEEQASLLCQVTKEALHVIESNVFRYDIRCGFHLQDAFLFSVESSQEEQLAQIAEGSAKAGLMVEETQAIPVPVPFTKAIRVKEQAKFHPVHYVYALAEAFEEAGGVIVQHCRVTARNETGNAVQLETSQGEFTCRYLVYATHTPPGVNLLHTRLMPYRSYAFAVKLGDGRYPDHLSYDLLDPYHYYRTQVIDGEPYLIAGGADHKTGRHAHTDAAMRELEAHVREFFQVEQISSRWSSQYYESVDGLPYIGFLPGSDRILTATGFGGNGMIYSNVAATVIKSILLQSGHPAISLFDPSRFKPVAGFAGFVEHNAAAAGEWLKKLVPAKELPELVSLAHGEARIVEYEGEKLGLFKDEQGRIHAVHPSCSHLHCDVAWNETERSWDCPCHGARYDASGQMLNGPASGDLKEVSVGVGQKSV